MKENLFKMSAVLKKIFGYGIMTTLFLGGFTFFAYVIAIIIGGDTAELICRMVSDRIIPILIYVTNVCIVLGLVAMYLAGEKALSPESEKEKYKKS